MDEKILLVLISALVGWFFGQGSELFREWRTNRRLKKALENELEDIQVWLHTVHLQLARTIQIYSLKGIEPNLPLNLTYPIYENFYKDICQKLSREQRKSYELIHGLNSSFNERIKSMQIILETAIENPSEENIEKWGNILKTQYLNLREISWHISYHLKNRNNPDLDIYGKTHKEYLKNINKHRKDLQLLIEKAKTLDRNDFMKKLDEEEFDKRTYP